WNDREYNGHGASLPKERSRGRAATGEDDVGRKRDQFRCVSSYFGGIARRPPRVNVHVGALGPTQLLQSLKERRMAGLGRRIVVGRAHANAPHPLGRPSFQGPCRSRTTEQ